MEEKRKFKVSNERLARVKSLWAEEQDLIDTKLRQIEDIAVDLDELLEFSYVTDDSDDEEVDDDEAEGEDTEEEGKKEVSEEQEEVEKKVESENAKEEVGKKVESGYAKKEVGKKVESEDAKEESGESGQSKDESQKEEMKDDIKVPKQEPIDAEEKPKQPGSTAPIDRELSKCATKEKIKRMDPKVIVNLVEDEDDDDELDEPPIPSHRRKPNSRGLVRSKAA